MAVPRNVEDYRRRAAQRLPRLVGPETACAMVLSGEPIGAEEAQTRGLVDAIVPDLDAAAVAAASPELRALLEQWCDDGWIHPLE